MCVLYGVFMSLFMLSFCYLFFCFFKQKTAYEMRISDWSSDVCSSDLSGSIKQNLKMCGTSTSDAELLRTLQAIGADRFLSRDGGGLDRVTGERGSLLSGGQRSFLAIARALARSEERRGGKECVSSWRTRGSPGP